MWKAITNRLDNVTVCAEQSADGKLVFGHCWFCLKNRAVWDGKFVGISGAFYSDLVVLADGFLGMEWVYCT